jgi:3-isopropylmalate/(R)-2-methylmalate dehydratase small subunit
MTALIQGRVWVVGHSVNTDAMYPAHAMKLPPEQAAKEVFYQLRPGWTDQVQPGDVVVAGTNFGLGSSRPVANLFRLLGIVALVADEFNSLFFRNAINAGLPALAVPGVHDAFSDGDTALVDLAAGTCRNTTTGVELTGRPLPELVLGILDDGGLMGRLAAQGYLPARS